MNDIVKWLQDTPTIDTNAYAAGDLVGTLMEFGLSGFRDSPGLMLQAVQLIDRDAEAKDIDLVLFDQNPSGTTFTDNAALDIADADLAKIVAVVPVRTYYAFADNALAQEMNLALPVRGDPTVGAMKLYGALVAREAVTYTAETDLTVKLGLAALG